MIDTIFARFQHFSQEDPVTTAEMPQRERRECANVKFLDRREKTLRRAIYSSFFETSPSLSLTRSLCV